jgi:hypothetical protein
MFQGCIEIAGESSWKTFFPRWRVGLVPEPRAVGVPPSGGTGGRLKPELQRVTGSSEKNVQLASGCIKNWYESSEGVSRYYCEVLLQQRIAAMPLLVVDETRTSKSCIKNVKNDLFGGHGDPKRLLVPSPLESRF